MSVALILRDLAYIKEQLAQICKSDTEQDERLTKVERLTWAGGSLVALLTAIFIPIAVAAIRKWLGL